MGATWCAQAYRDHPKRAIVSTWLTVTI